MNEIGIVAIGRNEGDRLVRCLESATKCGVTIYVDSGSSDNSVRVARELGADVVELDMSIPFSAARARNAGFKHLGTVLPNAKYVQFVDGDCEIVEGWIDRAKQAFQSDERLGVVAGRRRERYPSRSLYNRLCDIEWNTPVGDARACGGDAMMRAEMLRDIGGYNPGVIAGEEPELCVRLRAAGWKVRRIDAEMTLHDADMTRFAQWWRRMRRSGFAYAQGVALHGQTPERHWVKEQRSICFWAFLLPLAAALVTSLSGKWGVLLLLAYVLPIYRSQRYYRSRKFPRIDSWFAGFFDVLAKFPQAFGVFQFHWNRFLAKENTLIEYKKAMQ